MAMLAIDGLEMAAPELEEGASYALTKGESLLSKEAVKQPHELLSDFSHNKDDGAMKDVRDVAKSFLNNNNLTLNIGNKTISNQPTTNAVDDQHDEEFS